MLHIEEALRDFRKENGVYQNIVWDEKLNHNCFLHTLEMSKQRNIFHAIPEYLEECSEAVCMCSWIYSMRDSIRYLVFSCLGQSEEHKKIILTKNIFGAHCMTQDGIVYLTLRGR
jgi:hypothetical protein